MKLWEGLQRAVIENNSKTTIGHVNTKPHHFDAFDVVFSEEESWQIEQISH